MSSRIDIFEQILSSDPTNSAVLFGLAKEYEKSGDDRKLIETLERYLATADDEGNAYGMLARAYERTNQSEKPVWPIRAESMRPRVMAIQAWQKSTGKFYKARISAVGPAK